MTYKARQVFVVMRTDEVSNISLPVAVFFDGETAHGNADGYNLDMQEREIKHIRFSVAITILYE